MADLEAKVFEAFFLGLEGNSDIDAEAVSELRTLLSSSKLPPADQIVTLLSKRTGDSLA